MSRFNHLELQDSLPVSPAVAADPGVLDHHACLERAREAFQSDDYERALSYYSRALQYDINLPEAWCGQIRCLLEMNEIPEAITWSNRAMERFPKSGDILAARAMAESRAGRQKEAMGFADGAFGVKDAGPFVWTARGFVLLPMSVANARACFLKAVEMAPRDPDVRRDVARACLGRQKYQMALEQLRAAVEIRPDDAPSWFWIGHCQERMGDTSGAALAYRRALEIDPRSARARTALQALESAGALTRFGRRLLGLFRPA